MHKIERAREEERNEKKTNKKNTDDETPPPVLLVAAVVVVAKGNYSPRPIVLIEARWRLPPRDSTTGGEGRIVL